MHNLKIHLNQQRWERKTKFLWNPSYLEYVGDHRSCIMVWYNYQTINHHFGIQGGSLWEILIDMKHNYLLPNQPIYYDMKNLEYDIDMNLIYDWNWDYKCYSKIVLKELSLIHSKLSCKCTIGRIKNMKLGQTLPIRAPSLLTPS